MDHSVPTESDTTPCMRTSDILDHSGEAERRCAVGSIHQIGNEDFLSLPWVVHKRNVRFLASPHDFKEESQEQIAHVGTYMSLEIGPALSVETHCSALRLRSVLRRGKHFPCAGVLSRPNHCMSLWLISQRLRAHYIGISRRRSCR